MDSSKLSAIHTVSLSEVTPPEAARLLERCMAAGFGREKSDRLWRWKHIENPAGVSLGLGARDANGSLIALRPFMRWRLRDADGTEIPAVRAVDTAVAPEWRGYGLFSLLTRQAIAELESASVALIFNTPNEQSAPGYAKMGWRIVSHPRLWARVSRRALIGGRREGVFPATWQRITGGTFSEVGVTTVIGTGRGVLPRETTPPLSPLRDREWYTWRYAAHPNLIYYLLPPDSQGRRAIVRADRRRGREGIAIVDTLAEPGSRISMSPFSLPKPFQYAVTRPFVSGAGSLSAAAALARGWVPLGWRAVTFAWCPLGDTPATLLDAPESWAFSLGDLETF